MESVVQLLKKIYKNSSESKKIQYLIVGLGNPGSKYQNTRHNAGFCALTALADQAGADCNQLKFHSKVGKATIEGNVCLLMKPQTFMNESGKAVEQAREYYRLDPSQILVFSDDISLPPGRIRIRKKGSHGGHNGLRDIIETIGSEDFMRIKIGVGKKPRPDYDLAKWVLSKFSQTEQKQIENACQDAAAATRLILTGKMEEAMNKYHSSGSAARR